MNLSVKILLVISVIFSSTGIISAQQIYTLDLESSIRIAKEKSNTMLILQQRLNQASYDLKAATSRFRTHINMDLTLPRYTETVKQWEDSLGISFYSIRQNQLAGSLSIDQPLPSDGTLYIRSGIQNYVDYNFDNRLTQLTTSIGVIQPIEAFYGYNNIRLAYKQAKLAYDLSLKQLKRAELDLVYEISSIFYNLLSYKERLNIAQQTLERQTDAYNIARNKYNAGLIREVEALQMEVDLNAAINDLDIARVNYTSQISLFKEVMGLNLSDSIIVESDLGYDRVIVDVEKAVSLALENRYELKESEIQIELSEMEIKRRKAAGRISGNILLNYDLIGTDKSNLSVPFETSMSNSWQNISDRPGNFGAALVISIPILDWGENKARVNAARASLKENQYQLDGEKVSIEREIRTIVDRLQSSLKRLEMLEKNVLVAEKSFEISRQRYSNGEIDSQAMALERERLNNAYISKLESFITYKLLLSDLMRKTFYDFENDHSMLDI
jgi:outer membrane protein